MNMSFLFHWSTFGLFGFIGLLLGGTFSSAQTTSTENGDGEVIGQCTVCLRIVKHSILPKFLAFLDQAKPNVSCQFSLRQAHNSCVKKFDELVCF